MPRTPLFLALAATTLLASCSGGKPESDVAVHQVTGQITLNGTPVDAAVVTFYQPASRRAAFGVTDAEGRYELTTFKPRDGAVAGDHVVTVSKTVETSAPVAVAPAVDSADYDPTNIPTDVAAPMAVPGVPPGFARRDTTPLSATVTDGGDNEFDFDLSM